MSDNEIRNENSDGFDYSYSSPDSEEKRWIESIRQEYLPREEHDAKVAEIKKLHKKAKKVPSAIAVCIGIVGTLILGTGMALTLEWNQMVAGIIVGLVGMVIMLLTYPIYQYMITRGKKKYGDKIVKLADDISRLLGKTEKEQEKQE
ncbi:MAG: hypothetical protein NC037_03120 [Bacteroides sp.]|nr:hypothetical protein [Bacillota bacterium]MCM1394052.1 hypothetical protein [[Eubacterium] siraeum]MCM1455504.1 hypothetical protein [Bacteroides sp.]